MRSLLIIPIFLFGMLLFSACDEHEHGDDVSISILSPDETTREKGDTVHIHVEWTSEGIIHNISVKLIDTNDGSEIYTYEEHVHAQGAHSHHDNYVLDLNHHTNIQVEAAVWDHGGEKTKETVVFHAHPG